MSDSGEKSKSEKLHLFRPALFWDTDIATLNPETHARYIIGRVVTRGDMSDWNTFLLVPKLRLGTDTVKLRFIQEAELQEQGFPSWSLGTRNLPYNPKKREDRVFPCPPFACPLV
ncbi:hypothetical protein VU12_12375 [Desulfobulbus sp. US4]|nr:hypothetical protein [Desulfobulbus sp. US4]